MSYPANTPTYSFGEQSGPARKRTMSRPWAWLGVAAGVGVMLAAPGRASAQTVSTYGHAEVTIGFPHGAVTVGRAWDDHPRPEVVEVIHPECDPEPEVVYRDDDQEPDPVVIERRHWHHHHRRVVVIERDQGGDPWCDRRVVEQRDYQPAYDYPRHEVVYERGPEREIYRPNHEVTVVTRPEHGRNHGSVIIDNGNRSSNGNGNGGNHDNHGGSYGSGNHSNGPVTLFPPDTGRPSRQRGVQR